MCVCDGRKISHYLWRAKGLADPWCVYVLDCLCVSVCIPVLVPTFICVLHLGDIIRCTSLTPETRSNKDSAVLEVDSASATRVMNELF